ncbi:hypothetical protein L2E82_31973 [Cichorium intybus]|uniref:Uncharacterized protein n=1 Tax=Cichorium intybus TaxID=13427 RepID=A0ACB9BEQ2_CICIN|nr:hypothetical protein L2E82_31973 [Cichorium intybus]
MATRVSEWRLAAIDAGGECLSCVIGCDNLEMRRERGVDEKNKFLRQGGGEDDDVREEEDERMRCGEK